LLEGFDVHALGFGSADTLHLLAEAKKLAFEDRARYYADPAFAAVPVAELLSREYADGRRKLIDPARAATSIEAGAPKTIGRDTITLATADAEGDLACPGQEALAA